MIKFSIVITTKNRINDLKRTLKSLKNILERKDVELLICDDTSTDETQLFLKENFNNHILIFNKKSKGLIFNRNILNNMAKGKFVISLDDDANFLSKNPLEEIECYFDKYKNCAVISFRIFWGLVLPNHLESSDTHKRVNSFVGCGHVWRKDFWNKIPNYPSWFVFYGEESFASYHLFKNDLEIHYNPKILVHHRVDFDVRKKNKDYDLRLRRSFRSGWYLTLLFYPKKYIPRILIYTFWIQFKRKVLKGDFKVLISLFNAILDVIIHIPKIIRNSARLTEIQFKGYKKLPETKIYWKPENHTKN